MKKFYLIDDDENIRGILSNIIEDENIGIVVGEAEDGLEAVKKWSFYNPDIIIVDYLMPNLDGRSTMEEIFKQGFKGKFVMLSQVTDSTMKSAAYENGATFYLSKPVNYIEVKKVLDTVCKNIDLENSLALIQSTLTGLTSLAKEVQVTPKHNMIKAQEKLEKILGELGISGEAGKKELKEIIIYILSLKGQKYTLKDIYKEIPTTINARSLEQKIRRVILKAIQNIAEAGLKDSYDPVYTNYYSTLFDIAEVKREMSYLSNGSSKGGKVSIKKFIEGLISILELHIQF